MKPSDITSLMMVKNGAAYIEKSLFSIKGFVDKMVIYDTGSTDGTQEIIKSLLHTGFPIQFKQCGPFKGSFEQGIPGLTEIRNEMLDLVETEWALIIDDDEVYYKETLREMREFLKNVKEETLAVAIPFLDFIKDYKQIRANNFFSPANRLVRADRVEFRGVWPNEMWYVKEEDKWLNKFNDTRVEWLEGSFCHFGRCFAKQNTAQRKEENIPVVPFIRELPEVMQEDLEELQQEIEEQEPLLDPPIPISQEVVTAETPVLDIDEIKKTMPEGMIGHYQPDSEHYQQETG